MRIGSRLKMTRIALAAAAILAVVSIGLWVATGEEGYTRWPNSKLRSADAEVSQEQINLLAEIGFDSSGEPAETEPEIESRFAFGLMPGGLDPRHLLSVATSMCMGGILTGIALVLDKTSRHNRFPQHSEVRQ